MKRTQRRPLPWRIAWLVLGLVLASAHSARAQLSTQEEERLRMLSDPDAIKKKIDEKKDRPPFEFFKSQIAPFDVLPYVKSQSLEHPDAWSMRANDADYDGFLQTDPVDLPGMPLNMVFRRDARLVKEQRRGLRPAGDADAHPQGVDAVDLVRPSAPAPRRELAGDPDDARTPSDAGPGAQQGRRRTSSPRGTGCRR